MAALVALVLLGLAGSLKVVLHMFAVDADSSHSLLLWQGIQAGGMGFVKSWIYTQDNWLLSLTPLHFLGFAIFGDDPAVVIVGGWLIFVAAAGVSGWIVRELGARKSAWWVVVLLLLLGRYAHSGGFASYSTSHNITNLYGLLTMLLLVKWCKTRAHLHVIAIFALLVAAAISDPWGLAAYALPIALTGAALLALPQPGIVRLDGAKLLLTGALAMLAAKTKMLGFLEFLPDASFGLGTLSAMLNNIVVAARDLGGLLCLVPYFAAPAPAAAFISFAAVAALLSYSLLRVVRERAKVESPLIVFLMCALLSMSGMVLAFTVGKAEMSAQEARFLLNCAYLAVIVLAVLIERDWQRLSRPARQTAVVAALLLAVTGIGSNMQSWLKPGWPIRDNGSSALIEFLRANHLNYGYGPYWGSGANAVTILSRGEIRLRPVNFDRDSGAISGGLRPESSHNWYTAQDIPATQANFFVWVQDDGEECADVSRCLEGLTRQFGAPARTLAYRQAQVLIWDKPPPALLPAK